MLSPRASSGEHSPHYQSNLKTSSATNETEKLLDLDGLLEIARLISSIRDDGRFSTDDTEVSKHIDE